MTPPRTLRPLAAALLAILVAASAALAAEPPAEAPSPADAPPPTESAPPPAETAPAPTVTAPPPAEVSTDEAPVDGRVIVLLAPGTDVAAEASAAREDGVDVERTFRSAVRAYAATVTAEEATQLEADPHVLAVVPDEKIEAEEALAGQLVPNGVSRVFGSRSTAALIDGVDTGVDADVAIYDTGIDPAHPDLNVVGGYNCTSRNRAAWVDQHGHGTHVAGTVGARDNGDGVVGVAPGVRLWAVRILDASGEGYFSWWICGLDWIASQNDPATGRPLIEAVNMSVTRWGRDDGNCGRTNDDLLHQAICRVVGRGITVVAAAANDSGPATARVPAAYNEVITVSALADTDGQAGGRGGRLCSSWGGYDVDDTFADFSNYGSDVDLIAPGKCIFSTKRNGTYGYSSGTSMAAPHVTGAAALYRATRPDAPPSEVRWALQQLGNRDWKTSTDPDGRPDILLDVSGIRPLGDFTPTAAVPPGGFVVGETGGTIAVPLALGRGPGFIEPITLRVAAPAPLTAAVTSPTTLWGAASATTLTIAIPPSAPAGLYTAVVQAAYRTTLVREVSVAVQVENAPPVAVAPAPRLIRGTRASPTAVPIRLAWPPAIDQSPIVGYELGEVVPAPVDPAAAPPADPPASPPAPAVAVLAATGGAVRSATAEIPFASPRSYAVRATDAPGNTGEWTVAQPAEVVVVQESAPEVRRSAGWAGRSSPYALGGRDASTTKAGAWLRHTFTGRGIALVGPTSPLRGRAEIWLDGVRVATIDARSAASSSRVLLYAAVVDPASRHTIEVRVLGTPGRPRVDVDAFLVLR
jgi:subtilisin family serine protease